MSTRSNHHHIFITLLASSSLPRTPPITRRTPLSRKTYTPARSDNNRSRAVPSVSRAPSSRIDRTVVRTRRRAKAGEVGRRRCPWRAFYDEWIRRRRRSSSLVLLFWDSSIPTTRDARGGGTRREKWRRTSMVVSRRGARDGRDARAWYAGEV